MKKLALIAIAAFVLVFVVVRHHRFNDYGDGLPGASGATVDEHGKSGAVFNFRGEWNKDFTYHSRNNDVVEYKGVAYVAISDSIEKEPPNDQYWETIQDR